MAIISTSRSAVLSSEDVFGNHCRPGWKQALRDAVTQPQQLLEKLQLQHLSHVDFDNRFSMRVPQAYIDKMRVGDASDPLLLQVLPQLAENATTGITDPVDDLSFMATEGVLHKYHGRALLITTGACAVNCRYCFRRHYPYGDASVSNKQLDKALKYLRKHDEIDEIILSGGDPLMLDDARLGRLIQQLESIPHLKYLRLHTRLPVVLPARICPSLVDLLSQSRLRSCVVIHCNHPNEISEPETEALHNLAGAGITLLNQSVLLKGINDSADILGRLSKRLYDNQVLPYYLHLLDPVRGAMHFDVATDTATALIERMRAQLPGYLVPKLVREIPNSPSKSAI